MKVNLEYNEALGEILGELQKVKVKTEKEEKILLKKSGEILKRNVEYYMVKSNVDKDFVNIPPKNHDGSTPYVHMKDDVSYKIKKDKNGSFYVSVRGGKMTGFKWHLVNNGARNIEPKLFVEKAMARSMPEIDRMVHELIKKAVD